MTTPHARTRVTVPVTQETLEAFQHYANASGMSVGRAMADWLDNQLNAVTFAALRFEEVREELENVPRHIASKVAPEGFKLDRRRAAGRTGARDRDTGRPSAASPRLVIRGGKSPAEGAK